MIFDPTLYLLKKIRIKEKEPDLFDKAKMIFSDVKTQGQKRGYSIASQEYEDAFKRLKEDYEYVSMFYQEKGNDLKAQVKISLEQLVVLEQKKEQLEKQVQVKIQKASIKYGKPESKIGQSIGNGVYPNFEHVTLGLIDVVYGIRKMQMDNAIKEGYKKAADQFEKKLGELKDRLKKLKVRCSSDHKRVIEQYQKILQAIEKEELKIIDLNILLNEE